MKEEIQIGKTHLKILPMSRLIKKHFKKLFTSDSEVLRTVNGDHILTIFKNGRSSCCEYAQANGLNLITMQQSNNTKTISLINIFLRDPVQSAQNRVFKPSFIRLSSDFLPILQ